MPLKNLTLSVLPQFWIGWGLGTGKEHKCFSSLYLTQMLTSAQIKQVCNWSNTAFRRCGMLGLVYIAAVHVVCEYHTWHFEDSWLQSLLTNPLRPRPCQQTWCWASDGVIQTSLVFRLVLSLIPISANVWFFWPSISWKVAHHPLQWWVIQRHQSHVFCTGSAQMWCEHWHCPRLLS